jgi:hypothetical protein
MQAREIQRIQAEAERRERDLSTKQDKYFDPDAFTLLNEKGVVRKENIAR